MRNPVSCYLRDTVFLYSFHARLRCFENLTISLMLNCFSISLLGILPIQVLPVNDLNVLISTVLSTCFVLLVPARVSMAYVQIGLMVHLYIFILFLVDIRHVSVSSSYIFEVAIYCISLRCLLLYVFVDVVVAINFYT